MDPFACSNLQEAFGEFRREGLSGGAGAQGTPVRQHARARLVSLPTAVPNSIGLDNSIPFIHAMGENTGLVYDLMELWRTNSDYSVIQTLEQLNSRDKNHYLTDTYEAMLSKKTIDLLFQNFKFNLKLEEIILNTRRFAGFLLGKSQSLEFALKPVVVKEIFETQAVKNQILTRSNRELKMNKSTLWYQKRRLQETGSVRIYNKTKQYFTS